jgi:hypothetical protein
MRHVLSLVTGIVVAPLVWLLVAAGQGATNDGVPHGWLVGGSLLVGVGLVAGLIASLRTSPLGAVFAGVVFLGASAFMYLEHSRAKNLFTTSWKVKEYPIDLSTPLTTGVLAFAGGLLLMSVFSIARWRGRSEAYADEDDTERWSPIPPPATTTSVEDWNTPAADNWSYR